jgi:hypothetical protein
MRNKIICSLALQCLWWCSILSGFYFLSVDICFPNYVHQKDIQMGKIYPETEWSTQMLGTLQNVSSLVGFSMLEKGIRYRTLNTNHIATSTQHI